MKFKVVREFIDQDTKKVMKPGQSWSPRSDFEKGRNLAENNVVPISDDFIERQVVEPTEKRRGRPRKKKHGST